MSKSKLGMLTILLIIIQIGNSQDFHFSQFNETPTLLNPGETGAFEGDQRVSLIYRNQWANISTPYKTYGLAFDAAINRKKWNNNRHLGAGFVVLKDEAGDVNMQTSLVQGAVAYHTKVSDFGYLSAGIQGGFYQRSVNEQKMRWGNQFENNVHNPNLSSNELLSSPRFSSFDLSAGLSYTYAEKTNAVISNNGYVGGKLKIGAAIHHLAGRKYSFYGNIDEKLNWRYVAYGSSSIAISGTTMAFQPSAVFQKQGNQYNIIAGSNIRYVLTEQSKITNLINGFAVDFGLFYRWSDALILKSMVEFGSYSIGASYDFTISNLRKANNTFAGPEILIRYINPNPFGGGKSFRKRYKLKKTNN